jgi:hypothetical protein
MNTIKTDTGDALSAILSGREERVRARDRHLSEVLFACQITINIPGYPKRIENDCKAIEKYASLFSLKWDPILFARRRSQTRLACAGLDFSAVRHPTRKGQKSWL